MDRNLIVFYTRTGISKKVAQKLCARLGCEVDEIYDNDNRKGVVGFISAGKEALNKHIGTIQGDYHNPERYEHIIFITPIWASVSATPIRSYWKKYKYDINHYSIITTSGSSEADDVIKEAEQVIGKPPAKTQSIFKKHIKSNSYALDDFNIIL